ncbi:MAG: glycerol-3-phosphate 1-O-acyltransferase PlsY [Rickettsiales bacterium]|jgi:glycerol-3-phosphate acyltransferase PlsY|nr:glycerol-3-phosphate 1-O-acyltransferase PlsY [Rickettsiales bacterium]
MTAQAFIITYLICAIPFGLVISKFILKKDLRKIGSGSTGTTNVLRTGSKLAAAATLALDALKPLAAWWILGAPDDPKAKMFIAAVAVFAHCYPVYLNFKGGKGVATAWGTMWMFSTVFALAAIAVWIIVLALSRKSSLSALTACVFVPLWAWFFTGSADLAWFYSGLVVFVLFRHTSNIKRLLAGKEDNVKFKQ